MHGEFRGKQGIVCEAVTPEVPLVLDPPIIDYDPGVDNVPEMDERFEGERNRTLDGSRWECRVFVIVGKSPQRIRLTWISLRIRPLAVAPA